MNRSITLVDYEIFIAVLLTNVDLHIFKVGCVKHLNARHCHISSANNWIFGGQTCEYFKNRFRFRFSLHSIEFPLINWRLYASNYLSDLIIMINFSWTDAIQTEFGAERSILTAPFNAHWMYRINKWIHAKLKQKGKFTFSTFRSSCFSWNVCSCPTGELTHICSITMK